MSISAGDSTTSDGGELKLNAGNSESGVGGSTQIKSGNSATLSIETASAPEAKSGDLSLNTGTALSESGSIFISTGVSIEEQRGDVSISAGNVRVQAEDDETSSLLASASQFEVRGDEISISTHNDGTQGQHSGDLVLSTGDSTNGDSGSVTVSTGDATSGRAGEININVGSGDTGRGVLSSCRRCPRTHQTRDHWNSQLEIPPLRIQVLSP